MPSRVLVSAGYSVVLATEADEISAAQQLRYEVFAAELGAELESAATSPGLDVDRFDEVCDHLLIRDDATGACVGTYRMLPPGRSTELYSDGEFTLDRLAHLRPELVETGRSCVHPDHRNGAVIGLMWAGIARYMHLAGHRWLAGCASVSLADGGEAAAATWGVVNAKYLADDAHRVAPRNPWAGPADAAGRLTAVPPLLRGYLRLGAKVCGPPAHDPAFGTADFFVLLSMADVDQRYLRRFLGEGA